MDIYQRWRSMYEGVGGVVFKRGQVGSIRGGTEAPPLGILTQ